MEKVEHADRKPGHAFTIHSGGLKSSLPNREAAKATEEFVDHGLNVLLSSGWQGGCPRPSPPPAACIHHRKQCPSPGPPAAGPVFRNVRGCSDDFENGAPPSTKRLGIFIFQEQNTDTKTPLPRQVNRHFPQRLRALVAIRGLMCSKQLGPPCGFYFDAVPELGQAGEGRLVLPAPADRAGLGLSDVDLYGGQHRVGTYHLLIYRGQTAHRRALDGLDAG